MRLQRPRLTAGSNSPHTWILPQPWDKLAPLCLSPTLHMNLVLRWCAPCVKAQQMSTQAKVELFSQDGRICPSQGRRSHVTWISAAWTGHCPIDYLLSVLTQQLQQLIRRPPRLAKPERMSPKCNSYYEGRSKNSELRCRTSAHNHMWLGDRKWMLEAVKTSSNSIDFYSEMQTFCAK